MELILLLIYSFFAWLVFFKFKWLPWNITSPGDHGHDPDHRHHDPDPVPQHRRALLAPTCAS